MIPYLVVFLFSIIFAFLAQTRIKNIILFMLFSSLAILLPSILAGARDVNVGTDTILYAEPCYQLCEASENLLLTIAISQWDPIFTILIYLGFLKGDISWSLFLVGFFTIANAYLAIVLLHKRISMWKAYMLFLFVFFNLSLNIMRQMMAISVCLLAFSLLVQGSRKWKLFVAMFVAFLCHKSSIIFVIPLLLYYYMVVKGNKAVVKPIFTFLLIVIFLNPLLLLLISLGLVSSHFSAYIESEGSMFSLTNLLSQIIFVYFARQLTKYGEHDYMARFSLLVPISTLIFILSSIVSPWAFRIAYYFEILYIFTYPYIISHIKNNRVAAHQMEKLLYMFVLVYWIVDNVINKIGDTVPYSSKILGF